MVANPGDDAPGPKDRPSEHCVRAGT
jgi:DNA/RNA endonuclease G (NUC1)